MIASENEVGSQGGQCVCFNMALSLLGLTCKVGGIEHWLQGRHQIGFSFYCPGKTCGGQNWQNWEAFGRNWYFILYLRTTRNISKTMSRFSGFPHMQWLFSLLISLMKAAICPSVLLLMEDLCHRIITPTPMTMKGSGIFYMLYLQIYAYPWYLDSLYNFPMCCKS